MSKIIIQAKLITDDQIFTFDGHGILNLEKGTIKFIEQDAKITILLKENILIRETEEALLSYKFSLNKTSRFEVLVKQLQRLGSLELTTDFLKQTKNSFEVIYQLSGNTFKHHYIVNWRNI